MKNFISFKNVFKNFHEQKVLEDISFELEKGKFITLMGSNGAGKSTMLRLMAGLESCDKGTIKVLGDDPYRYDYPNRSDLFFIHENHNPFFPLNLSETMKYYKSVFPNWCDKTFKHLLKERKFNLNTHYENLSRGQKMQFLLMMALASKPKIMFLDEITSVIDIEAQKYFLDKLKEYTEEGGAVVITTNILSEMNDYTDFLLLLQDRKPLLCGPVAEMQKKYLMLKKTENHSVFQHPSVVKVRKDHDGSWLYLVSCDIFARYEVEKFVVEMPPKLEDILVHCFHTKKEKRNEDMVA